MLQCWPAQLIQHSSYATLPSIIGQHPCSSSSLHLFKSLDMYNLVGIPDIRGILHCTGKLNIVDKHWPFLGLNGYSNYVRLTKFSTLEALVAILLI